MQVFMVIDLDQNVIGIFQDERKAEQRIYDCMKDLASQDGEVFMSSDCETDTIEIDSPWENGGEKNQVTIKRFFGEYGEYHIQAMNVQ